jgi:hypothetical protein
MSACTIPSILLVMPACSPLSQFSTSLVHLHLLLFIRAKPEALMGAFTAV